MTQDGQAENLGEIRGLNMTALKWQPVAVGLLVILQSLSLFLLQQQVDTNTEFRAAIQANRNEIEAIKGGRFTARDGLEVWKEIKDLRADVAVLKARQDDRKGG